MRGAFSEQEVHGTASIPLDYKNPAEPQWTEAGKWLQRQAKLFRKQKLTDKRYRIMREVLGETLPCVVSAMFKLSMGGLVGMRKGRTRWFGGWVRENLMPFSSVRLSIKFKRQTSACGSDGRADC
jgi:hypothetical protein